MVDEKNFTKSELNISAKLRRFGVLIASTTLMVGGTGWNWQLNAAPAVPHKTPRSRVILPPGCPNLPVKGAPISETEYDIAVRLNPHQAGVYYDRGGYRALGGDRQGQIEDYDQAIKLDSDYADAYYNRGIARYLSGDKLGGIVDLSKAADLLSHQPDLQAQQKGADTIQHLQQTATERDRWIWQEQIWICID